MSNQSCKTRAFFSSRLNQVVPVGTAAPLHYNISRGTVPHEKLVDERRRLLLRSVEDLDFFVPEEAVPYAAMYRIYYDIR